MSKVRKTVSLSTLITEVNRRNRQSTCAPEIRQGWNALLESMLHANGVYQGYQYLAAGAVPRGELPGVQPLPNGSLTFPDDTRRAYCIDRQLIG